MSSPSKKRSMGLASSSPDSGAVSSSAAFSAFRFSFSASRAATCCRSVSFSCCKASALELPQAVRIRRESRARTASIFFIKSPYSSGRSTTVTSWPVWGRSLVSTSGMRSFRLLVQMQGWQERYSDPSAGGPDGPCHWPDPEWWRSRGCSAAVPTVFPPVRRTAGRNRSGR